MNRAGCTAAALLAALSCVAPRPSSAQVVEAGIEYRRDRATYHFDSPSAYDTVELVPHFFEQHYVLDNVWVTARVAYRAGIDWRTTVELTPRAVALATDYDTFFNPGNVVWVAGTTGDARMRSFRLGQEVQIGRRWGLAFTGAYRLRVDLADFLEGERTDTRNGMLASRSVVTTHEYTNAQQHEVVVGASREWDVQAGWSARVSGELTPAAVNRLGIRLPEKYPGQTLVYRTTSAVTTGRVELARGSGRWPLSVSASGARSWNYSATQWVRRTGIAAGVTVGRTW